MSNKYFEQIVDLTHSKDPANIELGFTLAKTNGLLKNLREYLTDYYCEIFLTMCEIYSISGDSLDKISRKQSKWWIYMLTIANNLDDVIIVFEFDKIPKNLKVTSANELYAHTTDLKDISGVTGLTNLILFKFVNNKITEIPENIDVLPNLQSLYIANNRLNKIPQSCIKCNSLTTLILNDNRITEIPEGLFQMETIEMIDVGNNKIKKLPKDLKLGPNVQSVTIWGNEIPNKEIGEFIRINRDKNVRIYF